MIVWINGALRSADAAIDARDRGFLLADGAFETLYVEDARPAFVDAHLRRLRRGLAMLAIAPPPALADLRAIIAGLARENGVSDGRASARITVSRGPGARGLAFPPAPETRPTMLVALGPAPPPPAGPLRLVLSARLRYSGAATNGFKALGGYVENMLAFNEARAAGGDDALLLNEKGRIVSTARANIFAIAGDGAVVTPPLGDGALPGVVRAELIAGADEHGVRIEEAPLTPGDVVGAPLFAANSLIGLAAATLAGGRPAPAPAALTRLETWYEKRLRRELASDGTGR